MNPFDLHGPEFLLFYFLFALAVLSVVVLLLRRDERESALKAPLDDPYLIAFLRGGETEALRVAALSLCDRDLLRLKSSGARSIFSRADENRLELTDPYAIDRVKRPIEKRVLEAFKTAQPISTTLESLVGCEACIDYARNLEQLGLLPGPVTRASRRWRYQVAIVILLVVAGVKILVALSRGRTNILFLILLAILAAYVTARIGNPFRTKRGEKFLQDVKSLFGTLRLRSNSLQPGGATADLVWLASAYGLTEVSPVLFPQVTALMPRKPQRQGNGGRGFFSSCGTYGCGGGGCGGGGCGGGGCGGCGS